MSEKPYSIIKTPFDSGVMKIVAWEGLKKGDRGIPYQCPNFSNESVQVVGTFGIGSCRIEGSNIFESPVFAILNDSHGNPLDFISEKIEQVLENSYWIRPNVIGGDETTNLNIYILICVNK